MAEVPDKSIEVDGRVIGQASTVRLSVKTAMWIVAGIFTIVMGILSYAYFDLKKDINASRQKFIETVDGKVDDMTDDVQTIRIDQATMKGDIKLILDRQTRDNPIVVNPNVSVDPTLPPPE